MNKTTKHRGPDGDGIFISQGWSFGHNRLSIIDLSSAGSQPMVSHDGRFIIIFNGEIYNFLEIRSELIKKGYVFKSQTDTEVLLYAYQQWGAECLQKLNGMFSFSVLDIKKEEIFLARDRVGIKPLYYYHKQNKFIFSSEIKAILQHQVDRRLNIEALNIYLRFLYIPSPLTIWHDIYKLPAGHHMTVKPNGEFKIEKYWDINKIETIHQTQEEIESQIKDILIDSVKKRLVSDRPVGVFLSGGIDSTIITGLMSKVSRQVNSFSIGFEKTEEADKYNNDFYVAQKTAQYFKTNHHELIISAADVADNLEKTVYHMDEPISNHVQTVNMLLAKYSTEYVKVALGGDGGDELFGGYERYYYSYLIDRFQALPKFLRKNVLTQKVFDVAGKSGFYNKLNQSAFVDRYFDFFSQKESKISSFLKDKYNQPNSVRNYFEQRFFSGQTKRCFTDLFMRTDLQSWLADESLARSDKMSMAYGLEQRVPFLDHRLVELAYSIPVKLKIGSKSLKNIFRAGHAYQGKIILKKAMSEYLPDFVLQQPKWGWFSPAAKWIRGPMNNFVKEVLSPSYCAQTQDLFDFKAIDQIFKNHMTKKEYGLNTIWSLLTFQVWYRQFMDDKL